MAPPEEMLPTHMSALLKNLKEDASEKVRKEAATALGALGDLRAAGPLIEALGRASGDVQAAIEGAIKELGPQASGPLAEAMKTGSDAVRARAFQVLCNMKNLPAELLATLLGDPQPENRQRAIDLLVLQKDAKTVPLLKENLNDKNPEARRKTLRALAMISPEDAKAAVPGFLNDADKTARLAAMDLAGKWMLAEAAGPLVQALGDGSPEVRGKAAHVLGDLREATAVDGLTKALTDASPEVRAGAAEALGKIGNSSALGALKNAAQDKDPRVQAKAAEALSALQTQKTEPELLADLKSPYGSVRKMAAIKLSETGSKEGLKALAEASQDADPGVRFYVVEGLLKQGDETYRAKIAQALGDRDFQVRNRAVEYFKGLGEGATDALAEAAGNSSADVRVQAIELLGKMKKSDKGYEALAKRVGDTDTEARRTVARVLGNMGPGAVDLLIPLLTDPDSLTRRAAVTSLGNFRDAKAVLPLLQAAQSEAAAIRDAVAAVLAAMGETAKTAVMEGLNDKNPLIRRTAVDILKKRKDPGTLDALFQKLKDEDAGVRQLAVEAIDAFSGERASLKMVELIQSEDPLVRVKAGRCLVARKDPAAVGPLVALLRQNNPAVREDVAWILSRTGEAAAPSVASCLADKDPEVRAIAAKLLGYLGTQEALKALEASLKDTNEDVREKALQSIVQLGDKSALETVRTAMTDSSEKVRAAAAAAIGVVGSTERVDYQRKCRKCGVPLREIQKFKGDTFNPGMYLGCLIGGFLLLPVGIGLFLILWAWNMKTQRKRYLMCASCKETTTVPWHE